MAFEWFVAKVKRHQSGLAERHLEFAGLKVYNPRIAVLKSKTRKWEDLFPGYLFCRVDTNSSKPWPGLLWTPGIRYFLPSQGTPTPINEGAVEEIQQRVENWNEGGYLWVFKKGDQLRVKSGPLKGLDAIFERYLPARERCEVFLNWLARRLLTVMNPADLEIATKPGSPGPWVKEYERIESTRPQVGAR